MILESGLADLMVKEGHAFYLSSKAGQVDCFYYLVGGDDEVMHIYSATSRHSLNGPMYYDCSVSFKAGACMPDNAIEFLLSMRPKGSDWKEGKLGA
tara:strand:+ start:1071 stop:1358 length:288 start_codon:yes stop_codon:yes gene_type:complete